MDYKDFGKRESYWKQRFQTLLSLEEDKEESEKTIENIKRGVEFKGSNLWILIFAIFIASIGLNVNSPAVIIGAMLISPLMGPIIGVGLGIGINDLSLIKRALFNLAIAAIMSVLTSALYFWISPINEAQSELLSRTSPTIWDVLIALFGGLAGIVAFSRKEKTNAIPGVAIATALMPPLCTAGFGLATLNIQYFLGAFYLFFINSVFICLSTFFIVRFLKYPRKQFADISREKYVKTIILSFAMVAVIPSVYTAYRVVQKSYFERNASKFIQNELNFHDTHIISKNFRYGKDTKAIELILIGNHVNDSIIAHAKSKMNLYHLTNTELKVYQNRFDLSSPEGETGKLKVIEDLYRGKEEELIKKDIEISGLSKGRTEILSFDSLSGQVADEIRIQYPEVSEFSLSRGITKYEDAIPRDTVIFAYIKFKDKPPLKKRDVLNAWLKVRLGKDKVKLVTEF